MILGQHRAIGGLLAALAVGCGSSERDGRASDDPPALGPGSYELTARNVTAVYEGTEALAAGFEGALVRIDLGSELQFSGEAVHRSTALLTARYGVPTLVHADWGDGTIALSLPPPNVPSNGPEDTRSWESIALTPDPAEVVTALAKVELSQGVNCGDCFYEVAFRADGSASLDASPPEARLEAASSHGPADALLPWDDVVVRLSEPAKFEVPDSGFAARDANGSLPSYYYSMPDPETIEGASGFAEVVGNLLGWPTAGQTQVDVDLGALMDLAGNRTGSFHFAVPVTDLGSPLDPSAIIASNPHSWGAVAFTSNNSLCESSTCAELGPFDVVSCTSQRIGFVQATTLAAGLGKLDVEYRVLAYGDVVPSNVTAFRIQVATPTSRGNISQPPPSTEFIPLATPVLGATRATEIQTFTATVFVTPGEPAALAIYAGPGDEAPCPGPSQASVVKMAVLIESIEAQ